MRSRVFIMDYRGRYGLVFLQPVRGSRRQAHSDPISGDAISLRFILMEQSAESAGKRNGVADL
jgi:hypothetical protein